MRLSIFDLSERQSILAGSAAGRKLLAALIAATPAVDAPEALFLDFGGVKVATSSFLRESVIGFRDFSRSSLQNIYPIVANATPAVVEELEFFTNQNSDALWRCNLNSAGRASGAALIGELDPPQRTTFDVVMSLGSATARQLAAQLGGEKIGPTAWNNRLSALAAKGLLVERRSGKTKSFSPLSEIV